MKDFLLSIFLFTLTPAVFAFGLGFAAGGFVKGQDGAAEQELCSTQLQMWQAIAVDRHERGATCDGALVTCLGWQARVKDVLVKLEKECL